MTSFVSWKPLHFPNARKPIRARFLDVFHVGVRAGQCPLYTQLCLLCEKVLEHVDTPGASYLVVGPSYLSVVK